ncbi:hypothetical protein FEM48_Zijuj12G0085300 [Ziziphus jujuba var. spinosa]|uniref:Uncharacterized protein n=1 Tax=Ziziphus jujuba var. spinosa TaxID=714518 RepID=A0A978UC92_ZIZJJ|nr:hypothetical protein FEM48_Zijuj12G0085300 [Ziziphus jujuba var. spinosa]
MNEKGLRNNYYSKRFRKLHAKQSLLRSVSDYADFMFQSWKDEYDEDDPSSSRGTSWFRKQYSAKGSRRERAGSQGSRYWTRRGFQVCEDDDVDMETIFRSAFGGNRFYYWSFINEENPQWRSSSNYNGRSWNWRRRIDEEYESSSEYDSSESSDTRSDRMALGLNASGPLTLEDVKNAMFTIRLKMRIAQFYQCFLFYQNKRKKKRKKKKKGLTNITNFKQTVAEEKFKLCSAAYQSLCDKLVAD